MATKENEWLTAARYGMPFGAGLTVLVCGIELLHIFDPSPRFAMLSYLWLFISAISAALAGMFAARATGSFKIGIKAGAVTCALPLAILFLIFIFIPPNGRQPASVNSGELPGIVNAMLIDAMLLAIGAVFGGIFGALAGVPGAWLGRWQARHEEMNTPSLLEQPLAYRGLPGAVDDTALMASATSADIVIQPSWQKSLVFCLMASLLSVGCYAMAQSGQNVVAGWCGVDLFGLALPVGAINIMVNRPLLRFNSDGITYKGAYYFWPRGHVAWNELDAIVMMPASSKLFGRCELALYIGGVHPWRARFQNWQLPLSTRKKLRMVAIRYRQQIDENDIVLRGIE